MIHFGVIVKLSFDTNSHIVYPHKSILNSLSIASIIVLPCFDKRFFCHQEFEMAAEIRSELNLQILEKASLVKRQMAWEQEKCRLGLHKLRAR